MTIKTAGQCAVNLVEYNLNLTYDATVIVAYGYEVENENSFNEAKGDLTDAKFFSDATNTYLPGALAKAFPDGMKWFSLLKDAQDSSDVLLTELKPIFEKKGVKLTNLQILSINLNEKDNYEAGNLFKAASDMSNLSKEQLISESAKELGRAMLTSDAMFVPGVNYWPDETIQQAEKRMRENPTFPDMAKSLSTFNMAPVPAGAISRPSEWACSCSAKNTGKFCTNCGAPAPMWKCECGQENYTAFCGECGKPRPQA